MNIYFINKKIFLFTIFVTLAICFSANLIYFVFDFDIIFYLEEGKYFSVFSFLLVVLNVYFYLFMIFDVLNEIHILKKKKYIWVFVVVLGTLPGAYAYYFFCYDTKKKSS